MGGFHQLLVMQRLLYKRYGCVGFKKWFEDSKNIASGSVDKAIEGRHYYRCMRIHKESFDAIVQTKSEAVTNNYTNIDQHLVSELVSLRENPNENTVESIFELNDFCSLKKKLLAKVVQKLF